MEYIKFVVSTATIWLEEVRNTPQLPDVLLVFVVGVAFGWFLCSLANNRRQRKSDQKSIVGGIAGTVNKKTREEVELDARRRL